MSDDERFADLDTRYAAGLALISLIPVAVYLTVVSNTSRVALSVVSVFLLAASLYLMLGPSPDHDHGGEAA
jgi:hypothetical protein